jgi:hypothetical protein
MNELDFDAPPAPEELQGILRRAVDGIRAVPPPAAQLDARQDECFQSPAGPGQPQVAVPASRRRRMRRLGILAAATAAAAGIWLGVSYFTRSGPSTGAFADTLAQIGNAKTIVWKTEYYTHITSKDGKRTWAHTGIAENAWRAPCLTRDVRLDDNGLIETVEIIDPVHGRRVRYSPKEKKATLWKFEPGPGTSYCPFTPATLKGLNAPNLQWVGTRKTAAGEANVFRHTYRWFVGEERDWSVDFWIDAKTKQLVAICGPGADIYDPEHEPARNTPPGEEWNNEIMGGCMKDIRYDVALDDSLFRAEPPEGYVVEVKSTDHITEKEMIEYLGILAAVNDQTFPDEVLPQSWKWLSKLGEVRKKPRKDLTAAERTLRDKDMRYGWRFGGTSNVPILFFVRDADSTVENSFRYLGNGVKLGDKNRIVCWYKLKASKDPKTYRVVYGDLSVKDVAPNELPLPVEH